ncbi:MAG: serine/threonine protein kinase, bacterial [Blastocatellia bacterium]|jgi:serine/threonine protein kinase|nr:serine/threonine protein kinase, bacterial [Blastocatellia bacterium]
MGSTNLSGQVLDEKYHIERPLGEGGMGAVYLATHLGTERPVALKVIVPQFMKQDEFVERFKREARAAGRLRHPNVVDVTDFGFARLGAERVAYLVMEYLDGCTLAEILAEEKRLPLSWVLDILEQACSALDEAHQQGIVHRDLKPDNIWLEPNRRGGYTVKVLDFGIAKLADTSLPENASVEAWAHAHKLAESASSLPLKAIGLAASSASSEAATILQPAPQTAEAATIMDEPSAEASTQLFTPDDDAAPEERTRRLSPRTTGPEQVSHTAPTESLTRIGSILGTPLYMSPEQCRGEASDARSDIYSLGVIAYQMLSGQTPFKGDVSAIMKQHLEAAPPPFKDKRVPKKTVWLIMSALAKKPDERPATAAAFSNALRAHSEGAGTLLRRALTLYSEHLPTFLRMALIIYSPLIAINIIEVINNLLNARKLLPPLVGEILGVLFALISVLCAFITASVNIGVTTRLVTQLIAAPLRPLHIRPAFAALKKRLRPMLSTTLVVSVLTMIGIVLCLIPGLIIMINYSLVTSVLMMEDKRGREAMRRAKELSKRSRRTVTTVVLLQMFAPIVTSIVIALLLGAIIKALDIHGSKANAFSSLYQITFLPITIFIGSFGALLTALLYLKMRQAGGETPREVLGQLDDDELPRRNWQLRMRERWHLPTRTTK